MQGFLNRKVPLVAKSNHGRYNFIIFKLALDDPKFFFSYENYEELPLEKNMKYEPSFYNY